MGCLRRRSECCWRVSVFAGGFTAEAAEAIADEDEDTLYSLESLRSNLLSSVVVRQRANHHVSLLQTVADFASAKLVEVGETAKTAVQAAHARYFLGYSDDMVAKR